MSASLPVFVGNSYSYFCASQKLYKFGLDLNLTDLISVVVWCAVVIIGGKATFGSFQ